MAYINIAEWTPSHVGDWLTGLDDSLLPYTLFFVNNQINGCRLLLLTPEDLVKLNVLKIGHQEIILEGLELLKQLHYNFTSETLQTVCLRLACKSRSLYNQLKQQALSAQNDCHTSSSTSPALLGNGFQNYSRSGDEPTNTSAKSSKKDKHKDKDKENKSNHEQSNSDINRGDKANGNRTDLSRISTMTLFSVGDILTTVKEFICWIDRAPFDGQTIYMDARSKILNISIEIASTAQRDRFVQAPNELIKERCKELADLSDSLVQKLNDSLAFQCAQLDVITVTKNVQEELGMFIHSSYSGVHVVSALKYNSAAQRNGQLEEGDEIVQINYRTVVGWQIKKLLSFMVQFPTKIILTVKKLPRHSNSGNPSLISPFALPTHDVFCQQQIYSQQQQASYYGVNYNISQQQQQQNHHHHHLQQQQQKQPHSDQFDTLSVDIYRTLPQPVMPVISADDSHSNENVYNRSTNPLSSSSSSSVKNLQSQNSKQQFYQPANSAFKKSIVHEPNKYRSNQIYGINSETLNDKETSQPPSSRFIKPPVEKATLVSRPVHTKKRKSRIATTRCSSASEQDFDAQDTDSDFSFSSEDDTANFCSTDEDEITENVCHRNPDRTGSLGPSQKLQTQYSGPGSTSSGTSSAIDPIVCENIEKQHFDSQDHETINNDDDLDDSDSAFYSIGNTKLLQRGDKMLSPSLSVNKFSSPSDKISQQGKQITSLKPKPDISEIEGLKVPRTSAEFEAIFLKKEIPKIFNGENTEVSSIHKDQEQSQLSSVHLSTISHLTSLAANIRFAANTPTSIATPTGVISTGIGCGNRSTHNSAQFDEPLAMRIKTSLERLTNGDTDMGDHQDFLYIYKGREQAQNKDKAGERLPSLGPMVYDPKEDAKWTKIHATLRENCLFTNQVSTDIKQLDALQEKDKEYQFEIPVHLPGYYILVNKTDILSTNDKKITGGDTAHGNPNTVLLYVFKLVTYHHLYLFGVESTAKLAKWICKFGYCYCCNPSDSHLCFTYYLSSTHVEPKFVSTRLLLEDSNRSFIDSNNKQSSVEILETQIDKENYKNQPDETESQYSCTSNNNTLPNTESELSSDDYLDLTLNDSRNRVKFDPNLNGIKESDLFGMNGPSSNDDIDTRKFAKSPHPGARFSVKASSDCVEFVESKVANENSEQISIRSKIPPQLPPRSSSVSANTNTSTFLNNNDNLPRPRPRISKMNSFVTEKNISTESLQTKLTNKTPTNKPILPPKGPFLNTTERMKLSSSPIHRSHLTPISVPEKSAAISQTIQHFANLQRQSILRRSNQQMIRATEKAEKEKEKNATISKPATAIINQTNNSFVTSDRSKTNENIDFFQSNKIFQNCDINTSCDTSTSTDYDYITAKSEAKNFESSLVGNPLYHSIANINTPLQKQHQKECTNKNISSGLDVISSSSSSSSTDSQESPPPPTSAPPPAPPVIRECVLKTSSLLTKFDKLSLDHNDKDKDKENIKLQESSVDGDFQIFNMNGKILNSPKISPRRSRIRDDSCLLSEESPKELPPILPRRKNIPKKTPPPIPTTAHPSKSNRSSVFTFDTPPEVPRTELLSNVQDMPILLPANKPIIFAKSLNRSFSDAYAKSPTGRVRPRKSLESGLPLNALLDDEDQNLSDIGLPYSHQYFSTNTPMSPAHLIAGSSTSDLNNSNRSLPTMGVSMLGKKRLSNVSADCYAIKEALNLFEANSDWLSRNNNSNNVNSNNNNNNKNNNNNNSLTSSNC